MTRTIEDLQRDFKNQLSKLIHEVASNERYSLTDITFQRLQTMLEEWADEYIAEEVGTRPKHAELGRHVEAVMKYFKGLA